MKTQTQRQIPLIMLGIFLILYALFHIYCIGRVNGAEVGSVINLQTQGGLQFARNQMISEESRPQMIKDIKNKTTRELASYIMMEKMGRAPRYWTIVRHKSLPQSYRSVIVIDSRTIALEFCPMFDIQNSGFISIMWYEYRVPLRNPAYWISGVDLNGVTLGGNTSEGGKNAAYYKGTGVENHTGTEHRKFWQNECDQIMCIALCYFKDDDIPLVSSKEWFDELLARAKHLWVFD